MSKKNYHVTPRPDGRWSARRDDAQRASSVHDRQADANAASRGYLRNQDGGELNIHGRDGRIRAKDTVHPGNDPRKSRG